MALGKNSRPGKRSSSSSSSSSFSTVSTLIFVAFCILGVYMLTSSSLVPSRRLATTNAIARSASSRFAKFISRNPAPTEDQVEERQLEPDIEESSDSGSSEKPLIKVVTEQRQEDVEVREELGHQYGEEIDENQHKLQEGNEESQQQETEESIEENQDQDGSDGEKFLEHQENQSQKEEIEGNWGQSENNKVYESESGDTKEETELQNSGQSQEKSESEGSGTNSGHETEESRESLQTDEQSNPSEQRTVEERTHAGEETEEERLQSEQVNQDETVQSGEGGEESVESGQGAEEGSNQSENPTEEERAQSEQSVEEETSEKDDKIAQVTMEESSTDNNQETPPSEEENGGSQESNLEDRNPSDSFQDGTHSESNQQRVSWSTQAHQSENEKERRKDSNSEQGELEESSSSGGDGHTWELCSTTAGPDYIPCLDNEKAIKKLHSRKHFEHRERHCPEEPPMCLVSIPESYKQPIEWPKSRDKIWYHNVPHTKLATVKGHQNWVKVTGEYLTFPGGGTQFIHGALHYIDFIQKAVPKIAWGKRTRVILDVGCGVASFGGFLFERDVLAMSFAPKDEHEAQVQFALERGIPAISAVMGSQRLPFPGRVFDIVHCARCRVPWHAEGGLLLLELNRVLRPGGYFVWSATPVYQKLKEDVEIWNAMRSLTASMCWDLITIKKDKLNSVGAAVYRKPTVNDCYKNRKRNEPPMCEENDDPNAAWSVPLQPCMHKVPTDSSERGSQWPEEWPRRLQLPPYWLNNSQTGIYGKPAPADFITDYKHWKQIMSKSYLSGLGISWSNVRNVMDMRAIYGGFAAALTDLKLWVLNVVNVDAPDTLPIIFERGLFGIYHDWCESFSTYPRSYDLLHADQLFSRLKKRCDLAPVIVEVDRILRPGGKIIVRDESSTITEVESLLKSLHWEVRLTFSKGGEGMLSAQKGDWRPAALSGSSR